MLWNGMEWKMVWNGRRILVWNMEDAQREAKYAKNHFQQNRYIVFDSHVMREESISTKILRSHVNSEMVQGKGGKLSLAGQGINALLGVDFLSAHYTEVAVAILLKMIFRVFSFS